MSIIDILITICNYVLGIPIMLNELTMLAINVVTYPFKLVATISVANIMIVVNNYVTLFNDYYDLLMFIKNIWLNYLSAIFDSSIAGIIGAMITLAILMRLYGFVKGKTFSISLFGCGFTVTL